jgi:uncharacterized membrane protein
MYNLFTIHREEVIYLPEENESAPAQAPAQKSDSNLIAAVSYLWILSIIILIVKKDDDFVTFHARQGTVLFGVSVILWVIGIPLFFLMPLVWLIDLVIFVAVVVGFIQALGGKRYKLPVIGDLAEKINL